MAPLSNLSAALATVGIYAARRAFIEEMVSLTRWDCRGVDDVGQQFLVTWQAGMRSSIAALRALNRGREVEGWPQDRAVVG